LSCAGQHNLLYDYLVIIHFETASCTDAPKELTHEIVEFSWIVFDLALAEAAETKQFFIKPEWAQQALQERPHLQQTASSLRDTIQHVIALSLLSHFLLRSLSLFPSKIFLLHVIDYCFRSLESSQFSLTIMCFLILFETTNPFVF
jgi:hypothetical protein